MKAVGAISHKRKDKCSLIASSARRSRLDSWAAVGCGWHATVRNFRQIGVHPPLTTPATVIPCSDDKRAPAGSGPLFAHALVATFPALMHRS